MLERKVEGVAVLTFGGEEPVLDQLAGHHMPIVLAEFHLEDPMVSTILLDYSAGIHAAVAHAGWAEENHRRSSGVRSAPDTSSGRSEWPKRSNG